MIAYDVLITRKVPGLQYDIGVIGQCQIYLKSVLWLIMQTSLSFFDQGYSYLVQQLPKMVCWWQVTFQITNIALESKAKVNFTQNM